MPEIFLEWVSRQSSLSREVAKLQSAFASFGIEAAKQEAIARLMVSEEFRTWASGKIGLHRPQSNYPTTFSRLTPSTMVGLAVQFDRLNRTTR
jgi:hypothetical protein